MLVVAKVGATNMLQYCDDGARLRYGGHMGRAARILEFEHEQV